MKTLADQWGPHVETSPQCIKHAWLMGALSATSALTTLTPEDVGHGGHGSDPTTAWHQGARAAMTILALEGPDQAARLHAEALASIERIREQHRPARQFPRRQVRQREGPQSPRQPAELAAIATSIQGRSKRTTSD
jgi:hypothetical protein